MKDYFVDLHIHIGQTESGERVKISSSRDLTFHNIMKESAEKKGLDMVGIIDSHSPPVQDDIQSLIDKGTLLPIRGGGLRYEGTTILLGVELEVKDPGYGPAHILLFMPNLEVMKEFSRWLSFHVKNPILSSQRVHCKTQDLVNVAKALGGIVIPAHIFSPFKSMYGSASDRISSFVNLDDLAAVELGLSADSDMADRISELFPFTFVTNSDAHSLSKIAREYNRMTMKEASFEELVKALLREDGRKVSTNYGLNPYLGKYHATYCLACGQTIEPTHLGKGSLCPLCGSHKWTKGVSDRINEIADRSETVHPSYRPPYIYQVPLEFIPGLGKKMLAKLLNHFGTEMKVLHDVSEDDLASVVPLPIAHSILKAREGKLQLAKGGGGIYGKVMS